MSRSTWARTANPTMSSAATSRTGCRSRGSTSSGCGQRGDRSGRRLSRRTQVGPADRDGRALPRRGMTGNEGRGFWDWVYHPRRGRWRRGTDVPYVVEACGRGGSDGTDLARISPAETISAVVTAPGAGLIAGGRGLPRDERGHDLRDGGFAGLGGTCAAVRGVGPDYRAHADAEGLG